ncbi:TlpA disulfide reductase family protein [Flavivirga sp. 57AJ16]|uniref:TlpA family protein disulfide reductase n=1 Tax=Flavivirga sp. 57AJ16 TaxID=3025307 RepID=UPI002365C488|nr:TlpA disulfide reductase family protein [Flavivirga sp. 57AJ16]MDD7885410.1 TlpA disulfide reductase family protein [Flavivirga sp. 57AJ16]
MNRIIKYKKVRASTIIAGLLYTCLITNIQAQEPITKTSIIESQADLDWKKLNKNMSSLGSSEQYQKVKDGGSLVYWKYMDSIFKKRSLLAKTFWDNYPEDPRRDDALMTFFSAYAEPRFIPRITNGLIELWASKTNENYKQIERLKPIDDVAWNQWRKVGDVMVASVLNSDASLERKEAAAFQLIAREIRYGITLNRGLTKEIQEANYWNRFEIQYWQHIRLRLENHVNKYAALNIVSDRVQNILNLLKNFSTAASDSYWQYFLETTSNDNPQAEQLGIKALHKLAADNVAAIEALKVVDNTKPLEMAFTAMDGTKVNLADMRGNVVLIDFWATYCSPCIKEMPHVREMYDKYRDQGFEVIGIAADGDANKERILSILKKTNANWPQRLDKGSNSSVSLHTLYEITALPTVWLLNKEGVIVDRSARRERLEPLIRRHLGLEK